MHPYTDLETTDKYIIREFGQDIDSIELVWHQDKEDRLVEVLEGEGWKFQRDNNVPVDMKIGDRIFIPEGEIHRIIKGTTNLKIKING
jgi:quercetin dioxygenase-like cupin family protein